MLSEWSGKSVFAGFKSFRFLFTTNSFYAQCVKFIMCNDFSLRGRFLPTHYKRFLLSPGNTLNVFYGRKNATMSSMQALRLRVLWFRKASNLWNNRFTSWAIRRVIRYFSFTLLCSWPAMHIGGVNRRGHAGEKYIGQSTIYCQTWATNKTLVFAFIAVHLCASRSLRSALSWVQCVLLAVTIW